MLLSRELGLRADIGELRARKPFLAREFEELRAALTQGRDEQSTDDATEGADIRARCREQGERWDALLCEVRLNRAYSSLSLPAGTDMVGRHVIPASVQGVKGAWRESWPDPTDAGLDELARLAGLSTAGDASPEEVRATTLRSVRALRWMLGVRIEKNKDDPSGDYQRLLRGIGALQRMRQADPELARPGGPFSLNPLDRVTRAHLELTGEAKPLHVAVEGADVRAVLYAAEAAGAASAQDVALRDFVPLPSVDRAVALLKDENLEETVERARGAVSWGGGEEEGGGQGGVVAALQAVSAVIRGFRTGKA